MKKSEKKQQRTLEEWEDLYIYERLSSAMRTSLRQCEKSYMDPDPNNRYVNMSNHQRVLNIARQVVADFKLLDEKQLDKIARRGRGKSLWHG